MFTEVLCKQFHLTQRTIAANLEGMTEQQAYLQPPAGGSNANWVLGHILASRNGIHRLLGLEPALPEDLAGRYGRGAPTVTVARPGATLAELKNSLAASQTQLMEALPGLSAGQLKARLTLPEPLGDGNLASHLGLLLFHESYHAGQLGVFRRLAGLEGAIT